MLLKRFVYGIFRHSYYLSRWYRRRFTKGGLLVAAGLAISAIVGLDTNLTMAYQAFTFLLALLLISMVWSLFFRNSYTARRILPRFGTVGETLPYRLVVQNKSGKKQSDLYIFDNGDDPRPNFREFLSIDEPKEEDRNLFDRIIGYHRWLWLLSKNDGGISAERSLATLGPNSEGEVQAEVVPGQRGYLHLRSLSIARPDPLGLFKSFVTLPAEQSVLILPKRYSLPPFNIPGNRRYQPGGVALTYSVGDSQEFVSMRDYRPGDPLRRIHWRSWAKTGRPVVREYQEEFFVRHGLILDTFQKTERSEKFEEAVSLASSFACAVQTQESLLDLMFVGPEAYCFTAGRGLALTDRMLEILASVRPCMDKEFDSLPPIVFERSSLLSGCICIFLSWDDERQQFISNLLELGIPTLVLVIRAAGDSVPLDPGPMGGMEERFLSLEVGRIEEGLAKL
ncbi:MAG: DUF58 domain-containing protein [Deltaproteobacteria bacterium]|nr:DUF58 domain-containing protein [Deltaproteobacteria bacterium]